MSLQVLENSGKAVQLKEAEIILEFGAFSSLQQMFLKVFLFLSASICSSEPLKVVGSCRLQTVEGPYAGLGF